MILQALNCNSIETYSTLFREWEAISERTYQLSRDADVLRQAFVGNPPSPSALEQYIQVITRVTDDEGQDVTDYFLEFFSPDQDNDDEAIYFHQKVLRHVYVNSQTGSLRCLFVDHSDLMAGYYPIIKDPAKRLVALSISAAEPGLNIRYFDSTKEGAKGYLVVHHEDEEKRAELGAARLHHNATHLVEIIIPRQSIDRVFSLAQGLTP